MPPRKTPAKKRAVVAKPAPTPKAARRSKLAKENDITAEEEAEIKEAWNLFRVEDAEGFEDEKEGVLRTNNVRHVLRAQGLSPRSETDMLELIEALDPENEGYVTYPHMLALCAIQLKSKTDESKAEEIDKAFDLFIAGTGSSSRDRVIRLPDLRAVAKTLKEDISDDVLKAMILEANGGKGVGSGVTLDEFQSILTRAGVFH